MKQVDKEFVIFAITMILAGLGAGVHMKVLGVTSILPDIPFCALVPGATTGILQARIAESNRWRRGLISGLVITAISIIALLIGNSI